MNNILISILMGIGVPAFFVIIIVTANYICNKFKEFRDRNLYR